ncbi:hypothetical protein M2321_004033 [Rhodoblastus acidophilus]|uniref:hypothetical protein n=1 Tax=Rhodoblastus acidophilus TaxID=1074 RepID=UPI0018B03E88|nr:hypothetical protein [Rhodoblastus acidophilus]MCW2276428.1 hypothetical protein [Rhodoblastus acidophilus]
MTEVSLDQLRQKELTHIVSLGPRCALAYNLRRYFDFAMAFPFDWWITPVNGLIKALACSVGVETLYAQDGLERTKEGKTVRHRDLQIRFPHEFPHAGELPGRPIVSNFYDHVDGPKRRTTHLVERFLGLNDPNSRILFAREPDDFGGDISSQDHAAISAQLARLFPDALWTLAIVRGPRETDAFGWKCDPECWDSVLRGLDVRLSRDHHVSFVDRATPISADMATL